MEAFEEFRKRVDDDNRPANSIRRLRSKHTTGMAETENVAHPATSGASQDLSGVGTSSREFAFKHDSRLYARGSGEQQSANGIRTTSAANGMSLERSTEPTGTSLVTVSTAPTSTTDIT